LLAKRPVKGPSASKKSPMSSASVEDFTASLKQALIEVEVAREERLRRDYESSSMMIQRLLGERDGPPAVIQEKVTRFWKSSLLVAVSNALNGGFKTLKLFNYDPVGSNRTLPKYQWVELKPGQKKRLLSEGYRHCRDPSGHELVVRVGPDGYSEHDWNVTVFCRHSDAKLAESLLAKMMKGCYEESILKGRKLDANGESVSVAEKGWSDIVLEDGILAQVKDNIVFIMGNLGRFKELGLPTNRGVLLEGPPGVGKTLLGTVLAGILDCTFIMVKPKDMIAGEVVAELFRNARRLAPTLLFVEDVDLIAPARDVYIMDPAVLSELLNQMDGMIANMGVFTVLTTNNPEVLEKAVADRPGRIERRIRFEPPALAQRRRMLTLFLGGKIKLGADVDIEELLHRTDGYTGAHLKDLISTAAIEAMKAGRAGKPGKCLVLSQSDIAKAMEFVKREREKYKKGYA